MKKLFIIIIMILIPLLCCRPADDEQYQILSKEVDRIDAGTRNVMQQYQSINNQLSSINVKIDCMIEEDDSVEEEDVSFNKPIKAPVKYKRPRKIIKKFEPYKKHDRNVKELIKSLNPPIKKDKSQFSLYEIVKTPPRQRNNEDIEIDMKKSIMTMDIDILENYEKANNLYRDYRIIDNTKNYKQLQDEFTLEGIIKQDKKNVISKVTNKSFNKFKADLHVRAISVLKKKVDEDKEYYVKIDKDIKDDIIRVLSNDIQTQNTEIVNQLLKKEAEYKTIVDQAQQDVENLKKELKTLKELYDSMSERKTTYEKKIKEIKFYELERQVEELTNAYNDLKKVNEDLMKENTELKDEYEDDDEDDDEDE